MSNRTGWVAELVLIPQALLSKLLHTKPRTLGKDGEGPGYSAFSSVVNQPPPSPHDLRVQRVASFCAQRKVLILPLLPPLGDAWTFSMQPSFGLPRCSTLQILQHLCSCMAHSSLRVNRDCLRRALVAQQLGTGQWDTGMSWWKSETPGFSLWLPSACTTLAFCFVCTLLISLSLLGFPLHCISSQKDSGCLHHCSVHLSPQSIGLLLPV